MNRSQDRIRQFILDTIEQRMLTMGIDVNDVDDNFQLTSILDSLGFLELIAEIEEKFAVTIDLESVDPHRFTKLGGFLECITEGDRNEEH